MSPKKEAAKPKAAKKTSERAVKDRQKATAKDRCKCGSLEADHQRVRNPTAQQIGIVLCRPESGCPEFRKAD